MILVEEDKERTKVEVTGSEPQILAELSVLVKGLKDRIPQDRIEFAVKVGLISEREINNLAKETLHQKLDELLEALEMDKDDEKEMDSLLDRLRNKFNKKDE